MHEKTRNGSEVTPKIAGIESKANMRSAEPSAMTTRNSGVMEVRPPWRWRKRLPV